MIVAELRLGGVAEFQSPHGTNSMFASDEERRAAWEARREELMARYLAPPAHPGNRPAAWWDYVAERPEHLSDYPEDNFEDSDGDVAAAIDAYEIEPIEWMAAQGHLTDEEIAVIEECASEARPRIGTDNEHIGSGGVDRVDRRAAKLHEAVQRALRD
jgi:hypothetical protein